jgi:hypothetical protein
MIISVSRRTDIPAYYSEWFYNRINDGYCVVPNPMNYKNVSFVDLTPKAVTAFVFWTRNPIPFWKNIYSLDELGYKYYFLFTLNNYPLIYERYNPPLESTINIFKKISSKIGNDKVIWRYDPLIITEDMNYNFHTRNFSLIASQLKGFTKRVVISIVKDYRKTLRRMKRLGTNYTPNQTEIPWMENLLSDIVEIASNNKIEVRSCAEAVNYEHLGIKPGKCIDDELLKNEFGIDVKYKKDKSQRTECRCTVSKDIGMNNTCLMGCEYCYANFSHQAAINKRKKHDSEFPSLIKIPLPVETINKINEFSC